MSNKVKIAIDAMGGENAPKKIIDGIAHHYKKNYLTKVYQYTHYLPKQVHKLIQLNDLCFEHMTLYFLNQYVRSLDNKTKLSF